jgi:hypothetical protein
MDCGQQCVNLALDFGAKLFSVPRDGIGALFWPLVE